MIPFKIRNNQNEKWYFSTCWNTQNVSICSLFRSQNYLNGEMNTQIFNTSNRTILLETVERIWCHMSTLQFEGLYLFELTRQCICESRERRRGGLKVVKNCQENLKLMHLKLFFSVFQVIWIAYGPFCLIYCSYRSMTGPD